MKRDIGEMSRVDRLGVILAALVHRLGGNVVVTEDELAAVGGMDFTARPDGAGGALVQVKAPAGEIQ